jgi:hypothetical protein
LGVITIGFLVLIIGLVLVALPMIPGGMLGTLLGLTILSTELEWARRLRTRILATGRRFLPQLLKRRPKDQNSLEDPPSAEEAGPSRHSVRGLPIVVIGLAVAAVLLAVALITQTNVATAP